MTPLGPEFTAAANAWHARAQTLPQSCGSDPLARLQLVHDGIALRRSADGSPVETELRRGLLPAIARAKQDSVHGLAAWLGGGEQASREALIAYVLRQLAADEQHLARLLTLTPEGAEDAARAIDAFRDDLSWAAGLVALLDGGSAPDPLSTLLAEQERLLESLSPDDGDQQPVDNAIEQLRADVQQLRTQVLAGMISGLGAETQTDDWRVYYQRWTAASRLAGHLSLAPQGRESANPQAAPSLLDNALRLRTEAINRWKSEVARLPADECLAALDQVTTETLDRASDTVTFLEDLPLAEEVVSLELLRDDLDAVIAAVQASNAHGPAIDRLRRSLRRRRNVVTGELQDRKLAWRLEASFGRRAVAAWERFVLFTLVLFLCLLAAEGPLVRMESSRVGNQAALGQVETAFAWIDLAVCAIFLLDFFVKLALVDGRVRYLWRNWLTALLPSLPFGFFAYATHHLAAADAAERLVLLRFLRYARLPQMARWLRAARPMIRGLRVVAFALRAGDRLVRQLAPVMNRNLVLFERAMIEVEEPRYRIALTALREQFIYRTPAVWERLDPAAERRVTAARLDDLADTLPALRIDWTPAAQVDVAAAREIPVESVVARLIGTSPAQVLDTVDISVAESVSRWCRSLDVAGVRRLPGVRSLVEAGRLADPAEATARAANYVGMAAKRMIDRVYWAADFYGTVTAPQLVDSLGLWLVKGASRPAKRLLLVGTLLLVFSQIALLLPSQTLDELVRSFKRLVATPLIVLGTVCLAFLGIGVWFRRIASQATEFYEHVAEAQYINALKGLKRELAASHYSLLEQNVIAPERRLACSSGLAGERSLRQVESDVQAMWNDYLDAAPFHKRDTKTTTQLLGNLVLVALRETRLNYNRKQRKRLRQLNLEQAFGGLRGPYLWFRFISRSVSQQTAKLLVDYNVHVLPLSRALTAPDAAVANYSAWLAGRLGIARARGVLPAEFREREQAAGGERQVFDPACDLARQAMWDFQGNDFTALHFLSADPRLEQEIRMRYGDVIADLMRRDRRDNIRRVFRTFPFHHWPKDRRTFNPLLLYQQYWAGGRALLLPLRVCKWTVVLLARAIRKLATIVHDVLQPTDVEMAGLTEFDPFAVAVRKIHRMRQPVFLECLRMRAQFDPEYLGVPLLDESADSLQPPVEHDLGCIDADPLVEREVRELAIARQRQMLDFRAWMDCFGWHCRPDESCRAMAIAYAIDYQGLRKRLKSTEVLEREFAAILSPTARPANAKRGIKALLAGWWPQPSLRGRFDLLFAQPAFRRLSAEQQSTCRRHVEADRGELRKAVLVLTSHRGLHDPVEDAQQRLAAISRDPSTWSRQLAVLRAVQTLTVIDLQIYCDLVRHLGDYGPDAEQAQK